ncbi:MAG: 8-oxo-dGTP diphosphatase MutT [Acidobacteria bacterium]|nr:MAG: 8-oxo-dGTP diphosphatase MutT [Acidobacteriota bacterium]
MIVDVVAAVIRDNGKILITQRFDHVHLPGLWEFPGGKVEAGESLEAALKREIREELGLEIAVEDEIFTIEHEYPTKTVRLHFFNCSIIEGDPQPIEVADLRWVRPAELGQFEFPPADAGLIRILRGD